MFETTKERGEGGREREREREREARGRICQKPFPLANLSSDPALFPLHHTRGAFDVISHTRGR